MACSDTLRREVLHIVVLANALVLLRKLLRDSQRIAPRDELPNSQPTSSPTPTRIHHGDYSCEVGGGAVDDVVVIPFHVEEGAVLAALLHELVVGLDEAAAEARAELVAEARRYLRVLGPVVHHPVAATAAAAAPHPLQLPTTFLLSSDLLARVSRLSLSPPLVAGGFSGEVAAAGVRPRGASPLPPRPVQWRASRGSWRTSACGRRGRPRPWPPPAPAPPPPPDPPGPTLDPPQRPRRPTTGSSARPPPRPPPPPPPPRSTRCSMALLLPPPPRRRRRRGPRCTTTTSSARSRG